MKLRIDYSNIFIKDLRKSSKKVRVAFKQRLEIYLSDKYHPILNNHRLKGDYDVYRSINITGDWRAIFRELDGGSRVYFDRLGTHSQLYK